MRIILLFLVLFISKLGFSQGQPWVGNNAVWEFYFEYESLDDNTGTYKVRKTGEVMRGTHLCDELITYEHSFRVSPLDSAIVDTNYTYLSVTGDSIMYEQDGIFRVLYDFSKLDGDSTLCHVSSADPPLNDCNDSSYAIVVSSDIVSIETVNYRTQQIDGTSNSGYFLAGTINERFGPMDYLLFPIKTTYCWPGPHDYSYFFLCFSDDDLEYGFYCGTASVTHKDSHNLHNIDVSPNPFTHAIHIDGLSDVDASIQLSDNLGTTLFKGTVEELETYNVHNLSTGCYWLSVTLEDGHSVIKQLVKQ